MTADTLLDALKSPASLFLQLGRRTHYAYLLAALLLAIWVYWRTVPKGPGGPGLRGLPGYLFPSKILRHPSTWLDVRLAFINQVVRFLLLVPLIVSAVSVAVFAVSVLTDLFGAPGPTATPTWLVVAAFALVLFVADDLTRYLLHRAEHRIPWLWEFHKIHHSGEVINPLTVHRFHPVESLLLGVRASLTSGIVTGIFFYAFPGSISPWSWFGVNAFNFGYTAFGSNLRHSHIWLSFGPKIEHVFCSPAQHQIHHSSDPKHHDRNFATALSLWDWLGHSLHVTEKTRRGESPPALTLGLGSAKNHKDTVLSAYAAPFIALFRRRSSVTQTEPSPAVVAGSPTSSCLVQVTHPTLALDETVGADP